MKSSPSRMRSGIPAASIVPVASLAIAMALVSTAVLAATPDVARSAKVGKELYELVYNPGDNHVYVAATGEWDMRNMTSKGAGINVIDPASLKVVRHLPLGQNPVFGLGLNSRTQTLYGTNTVGGNVSAIDAKTGKLLATIVDPGNPKAHVRKVAIDEKADKVYVSVVGGFSEEPGKEAPKSAIWIIDGKTHALEDVIVDPVKTATGIALDAAAGRLYVADLAQNQIGVIDLATRKPLAYYRAYDETEVTIEKSPRSGRQDNGAQNIAIDLQGQRLFVTNPGSGTLTVIDARTGRLLKTVKTGNAPLDVAWNPNVRQAYVSNRGNGEDGTVTVVDGDSYAVLAQLKTGTYPQTIAVGPEGSAVYVSNKAKGLPRDAAPGTPVPQDPGGDTVAVIRP